VRRQLLELDPTLTSEFLKTHREAVDEVIASVFERVSTEVEEGGQNTGRKPWTEDGRGGEEEEESSPPPKKSKKGSKQEQADAELARKLSSEINGRSTRTSGKGRGGAAKRGSRGKKSAATIDSDDDSNEDGGKKTRKRTTNGSGAKGGFAKEFALSAPLSALLQIDRLSRPQVVKHLWVYIKDRELQNPDDKREILCDPRLKAVFGVEKIDMFRMNKVLGQHLHEIE
jgi:upstream activation factor subunit UAF30